tara:strand:+ start:1237 stop:1491 length:255 start_codon:yes stop_codon:yes gene_type:complete
MDKPTLENPVSITEIDGGDIPDSEFRKFAELDKPNFVPLYKMNEFNLWRFKLVNYNVNVNCVTFSRNGNTFGYRKVIWRLWWRL